MSRPDREILERLGKDGVLRVLGDVLDHGRLVKLANACGLAYPGMRTQSQKRERLLADLAEKAFRDDAAGKSLLRALRKETAAAERASAALPPEERGRRLREGDGKAGVRIFLAACSAPDAEVDAFLAETLHPDGPVAPPAPASAVDDLAPRNGSDAATKEVSRWRKKVAELQNKIRYLDGQIAKNRDAEKALKRDLIQRKGELAEARMLAERLRRDLDEARGAAAAAPRGAGPAAEGVEREVRKLAAEQRKLAHRLEKAADAPPPLVTVPAETLAPLAGALEDLQKELAALKKERRRDQQEHARRLDELQAALQSVRAAAEAAPRPSRAAPRRKGEPERVGVFIDVQNVYYPARQLKGKLDFDALLAAAVLDRRLIQATAYVVESKETDQFGFFAMLQQRAIEVRRKTLTVRADGSMKGDWDMEMALDILDAAPKLDVVVLVSGDGDFTSLVQRVKRMGPKVEVLGFPRNTAKSLLEAADRFTPLDRKFVLRSERPGAPVAPDEPAAPVGTGTGSPAA